MTKTILITLMALFTISCASRRDAQIGDEKSNFDISYQHAQSVDGPMTRIR